MTYISLLLYIYLIILFYHYKILVLEVLIFGGIFSLILKNYFKEKRPNGLSYGMPSSHMQMYTILLFGLLFSREYILAGITLALIVATFISKSVNNEHDTRQLLAGIYIGFILSFVIKEINKNLLM